MSGGDPGSLRLESTRVNTPPVEQYSTTITTSDPWKWGGSELLAKESKIGGWGRGTPDLVVGHPRSVRSRRGTTYLGNILVGFSTVRDRTVCTERVSGIQVGKNHDPRTRTSLYFLLLTPPNLTTSSKVLDDVDPGTYMIRAGVQTPSSDPRFRTGTLEVLKPRPP